MSQPQESLANGMQSGHSSFDIPGALTQGSPPCAGAAALGAETELQNMWYQLEAVQQLSQVDSAQIVRSATMPASLKKGVLSEVDFLCGSAM